MVITSRHRRQVNKNKGKAVDGKTGTDAIMAAYGNKRIRETAQYRQVVATAKKGK